MILWILLTILITHTSSQYYIFDPATTTMPDAEALCLFSYGTNLASIHNSTQNDEAKSLCPTSGPECWIGATDADIEDTWTWTDGTPFDYGSDVSGGIYPWDDRNHPEPNNSGGDEDCVHLYTFGSDRDWNDNKCDQMFASICKYPSSITVVNDNINNVRQPIAGTIIGYMDVLDEVHVEFDFIVYSFSTYYANMIRIGNSGLERYPAFYIHGGDKRLHLSFTRITEYNTQINYQTISLNSWYHLEYHATQTSVLVLLNSVEIGNEMNHDSHAIMLNKPVYISAPLANNYALDGRIRDLKISTNNAYVTPFNYLCDYNNRFTVIKGNWSVNTSTCWLTQHDEIGEGNVVWLGDIDATSLNWTDYKIEFIVHMLGGGISAQAGLLFRAQTVGAENNAGQQYVVDWRDTEGIRFCRMNDHHSVVDTYAFTPNYNEDYLIRVEAESNNFKIYHDNALVLTVSHSEYTFGSVGFRTYRGAAIFKKLRIIFPDNNNWISFAPTSAPTSNPTPAPTLNPTLTPTNAPSQPPSNSPTLSPSLNPTIAPSLAPSLTPSSTPTSHPSNTPSSPPTISPSLIPSIAPSNAPSTAPSIAPTPSPTTPSPTLKIITFPSLSPTLSPETSTTIFLETQDGDGENEGLNNNTKLLFGLDIMVILIVIIVLCCIILLLCIFYGCYFRRKPATKRRHKNTDDGRNALQSNSDVHVTVAEGGNINVQLTNYNKYKTPPLTANINSNSNKMERVQSSSVENGDTPIGGNNVHFALNMMNTNALQLRSGEGKDGLTTSQLKMAELPLPKEDFVQEEDDTDDEASFDKNVSHDNMYEKNNNNKMDLMYSYHESSSDEKDDDIYNNSHVTTGGCTTTGK